MRKASIGIVGALLLATLVIAVVPAFARSPGYCDRNGNCLRILSGWAFTLRSSKGDLLCLGEGAKIVNNVLSIRYGKCAASDVGASFLTAYGKTSTPIGIAVALVYLKPPRVDMFMLTLSSAP